MKLKFYKEESNKWYVDLPTWEGSKAELEMVSGADVLLDLLSKNGNNVKVEISTSEPLDYELYKYDEDESGSYYFVWDIMKGEKLEFTVWLCNVSIFVFGFHPERIGFKRA